MYFSATDKCHIWLCSFRLLPLLFTFPPSWSAVLPLKSRHPCVSCAHERDARPHGRIPEASEWHAADTPREHSAHFPTTSRPKQGAETRQEWRGRLSAAAWRCQSRAGGKPKIAVITWSAADTHCDVCACAWLCAHVRLFPQRLAIAASHKREMDANHSSDIMIPAGRCGAASASNIFCFGYLPVLVKRGDFEGRISCVIHHKAHTTGDFVLFQASCCFVNTCFYNKYKGRCFHWVKKWLLQLLPLSNPTININCER